jgi:hypothetical protein
LAASACLVAATGLALLAVHAWAPPDPYAAARLVADSPALWLKSLHAWGATLLLSLAIACLIVVWGQGGASVERARLWWPRVAILLLVVAAFLLGGLVPADQHAWESYRHVVWLLDPDPDVGQAPKAAAVALAAHALLIPAAILGVLLFWERAAPGTLESTWAHVASWPRLHIAWWALLGAAAMAALSPPQLGPQPIADISVSRPRWPFLWLVPLEERWGVWGLAAGISVVLALLLAQPWMAPRMPLRARAWAFVGLVGAFMALWVAGWR